MLAVLKLSVFNGLISDSWPALNYRFLIGSQGFEPLLVPAFLKQFLRGS